jgi:DNA-binding response OmpR family regulator
VYKLKSIPVKESLREMPYNMHIPLCFKFANDRKRRKGAFVILVIEDDGQLRDAILDALSVEGYAAHGAENGAEAMKLLEHHAYSLVITDYSMPVMNGAEITKTVRSRYPGIFIIGMSGEDKAGAFLEAGADLYLPKPLGFKKFMNIIREARQKPGCDAQPRLA